MADTSPSAGFLKKFLGIKPEATDIELPPQTRSGKEKKKKMKSKFDQIKEGYQIFKNMGKKEE